MLSKVRFFDPGKTFAAHKEEYLFEIERVLDAGDLILRDDVEKFEQNLALFCGKKYAVGLNSGTDALYLSLMTLSIGVGDEVILPSHTFVATAQVVHQLGATPVLVDMGEDWRDNITRNTKAVIPAHLAGEVLDWEPAQGIAMVDDSCQGIGAKGFKGIVQCWSFYPAKILGAFGDAGGITTDDKEVADSTRELRNHWKSDYSEWGINSRLDNIQAAILNVKMKYLPQTIARRKEIAEMYTKGIVADMGKPLNDVRRVWQDYIIYTQKRDDLYSFLKVYGIETMKNEYPMPIKKGQKSLTYEANTLRLPINEVLTDQEVQYVIDTINAFHG